MDKLITYVGLDVHKDTIAVALAEAGKELWPNLGDGGLRKAAYRGG